MRAEICPFLLRDDRILIGASYRHAVAQQACKVVCVHESAVIVERTDLAIPIEGTMSKDAFLKHWRLARD